MILGPFNALIFADSLLPRIVTITLNSLNGGEYTLVLLSFSHQTFSHQIRDLGIVWLKGENINESVDIIALSFGTEAHVEDVVRAPHAFDDVAREVGMNAVGRDGNALSSVEFKIVHRDKGDERTRVGLEVLLPKPWQEVQHVGPFAEGLFGSLCSFSPVSAITVSSALSMFLTISFRVRSSNDVFLGSGRKRCKGSSFIRDSISWSGLKP